MIDYLIKYPFSHFSHGLSMGWLIVQESQNDFTGNKQHYCTESGRLEITNHPITIGQKL